MASWWRPSAQTVRFHGLCMHCTRAIYSMHAHVGPAAVPCSASDLKSLVDSCAAAAANPGARVFIAGGAAPGETPKILKTPPWAAVKELLAVVGDSARFNGVHLVTEAGPIAVPDGFPDGAPIS